MSYQWKENESPASTEEEVDLLSLVRKMQKHLIFLERKIDTLIEQTKSQPRNHAKGQPFNRGFQRPQNSFGRPRHSGGFNQEHRPGGFNKDHRQGRGFEKPWRNDRQNRFQGRNKKRHFNAN